MQTHPFRHHRKTCIAWHYISLPYPGVVGCLVCLHLSYQREVKFSQIYKGYSVVKSTLSFGERIVEAVAGLFSNKRYKDFIDYVQTLDFS